MRSSPLRSLLVQIAQVLNRARIDLFCHAIKVDQEAYKDFVTGGTIFVDAVQIAQYRDAGYVLAVECQDTVGLRAYAGAVVRGRHLSMQMLMLHVIRSRDLGKKTGHHFNDVLYRHSADFVLGALIPALLPEGLPVVGEGFRVIIC